MEVVKIGKREVDKEAFIHAVANNKSLTHIIDELGFKSNVTTTRWDVETRIKELGLDTSHLKKKKIVHEEEAINRVKQFTLNKDNQQYYDSFLPSLAERSTATYKSSVGNFMESIGSQDLMTVTGSQILEFANTKESDAMKRNVEAHLRSLMVYCITNDINNAVDKVSKEMLIWLISK